MVFTEQFQAAVTWIQKVSAGMSKEETRLFVQSASAIFIRLSRNMPWLLAMFTLVEFLAKNNWDLVWPLIRPTDTPLIKLGPDGLILGTDVPS